MSITAKRLTHMLGVARRCYDLAKEDGCDEAYCRKMFALGLLHDIGYEFDEGPGHAVAGAMMLQSLKKDSEAVDAIAMHGLCTNSKNWSHQLQLLNKADMAVDSAGSVVNVSQRLRDIGEHYGYGSTAYLCAKQVAECLEGSEDS